MATAEVIRPTLTFEMFQAGLRGGVLFTRIAKYLFGRDNYDQFRRASKQGEYIPELERQRVDRQVYATVGQMFGIAEDRREDFWQEVLDLSNATVNYARGILFADQERMATFITDIARDWDEGRPSTVLERLTQPTTTISERLKFEQGRQLVVALLCAEVVSGEENGRSKRILSKINDEFYQKGLIRGRRGDPRNYPFYSYHTPVTNRLVGVSRKYPDPRFAEGLWVKALDYPVRQIGVRNAAGNLALVPAIYDPREKKIEAAVIKAMQRSLEVAKFQDNGSMIETSPYVEDKLGLRFVIMQGERPLRDRVIATLEDVFKTLEGVYDVKEDDLVDLINGHPQRVQFRRRQVYIEGLKSPLEVIVQTAPDFISYLYEVGQFNPALGMHDGSAHDLYKLAIVAGRDRPGVAGFLWPDQFHSIDLQEAKRLASYEYATRLGRKQRIRPAPYTES